MSTRPDKQQGFDERIAVRKAERIAKATKNIKLAKHKRMILQYSRTLRRVKNELDSFSVWCKKTQARVDKVLFIIDRDFRNGTETEPIDWPGN